ncbi:hypothetical protein TrRE_jg7004 [Triparma retinervis]|uniref:Protein kinase domain-containing protein n=1 Tax=Triparma retinervis TaxID=2557542 RepID=A0A9W7E579_9STRA|nr:hypothetical protein TrRE_jg7004 [Triparma retinervis]
MIGDFGHSHSKNPKISGAAPWTNPNQMDTMVGTVDYMSPEMVKNQQDQGAMDSKYSSVVDEWSCGCIFYLCLTGVLPFSTDKLGNTMSTPKIFKAILDRELEFPEEFDLSDPCKDLISLLLDRNAERRITAEEALELRFFNDVPDRPSHLTDAAIQRRKDSLNMTMEHLKAKRRDSISHQSSDGRSKRMSGNIMNFLKQATQEMEKAEAARAGIENSESDAEFFKDVGEFREAKRVEMTKDFTRV